MPLVLTCDDGDAPVVGQFEDDVVVDEVERVVERADRQLRRPVQLHVARRDRTGARHGPPRRPAFKDTFNEHCHHHFLS